jgi:hypothetical protein
MKRTQIYLTNDEWKAFRQRAKREHTTVSSVIRSQIGRLFLKRPEFDFDRALERAFGLWKDREDISSTEQYLRQIRKGKRLDRWH